MTWTNDLKEFVMLFNIAVPHLESFNPGLNWSQKRDDGFDRAPRGMEIELPQLEGMCISKFWKELSGRDNVLVIQFHVCVYDEDDVPNILDEGHRRMRRVE